MTAEQNADSVPADEIREGDSVAFPSRRYPWKVLEVRRIAATVFLTVKTPRRQRVISFPHDSIVPVIREQNDGSVP